MIFYYLHKLVQTIASLKLAIFLPNARWNNWVVRYTPKEFSFQDHVVLGFWDTQLFHLGDQLFHIGLIRSLQEAGVRVTIAGNTPLQPLFEKMNVDFVEVSNLKNIEGALILSKDDIFFGHLRKNKHNAFIGVNYRYIASHHRIGEILFEEIQKSLSDFGKEITMKSEHWNLDNLIPESNKAFKLPINTILYHDFVVSGALSAYQRLDVIFRVAKKLAKQGFKLVYIGNKKQKKQRPAPEFVSFDMRGESGIMDLFTLVKNSHVKGVVTYDTLLAHVANLVFKKAYVINKQEHKQDNIWNRFVPMSQHIGGDMEKY